MMGNTAIVEEQYDVKAGRWPSAYNECVVVLTSNGTVPDLVSYAWACAITRCSRT